MRECLKSRCLQYCHLTSKTTQKCFLSRETTHDYARPATNAENGNHLVHAKRPSQRLQERLAALEGSKQTFLKGWRG